MTCQDNFNARGPEASRRLINLKVQRSISEARENTFHINTTVSTNNKQNYINVYMRQVVFIIRRDTQCTGNPPWQTCKKKCTIGACQPKWATSNGEYHKLNPCRAAFYSKKKRKGYTKLVYNGIRYVVGDRNQISVTPAEAMATTVDISSTGITHIRVCQLI